MTARLEGGDLGSAMAEIRATLDKQTSLGMLPLAYGVGSGADMLKPLAVAVIGALSMSVLLSLVATPTAYFLMKRGGTAAWAMGLVTSGSSGQPVGGVPARRSSGEFSIDTSAAAAIISPYH